MSKRVLLIDDDHDDAEFFHEAFITIEPDIAIVHLDDGEKAIDFMLHCEKDKYPNVIFMDINMPVINGWECLRAIKKIMAYNQIPIVMFSSSDFKNEKVTPADVGATAFVTKADTMEGLKSSLASVFNNLF